MASLFGKFKNYMNNNENDENKKLSETSKITNNNNKNYSTNLANDSSALIEAYYVPYGSFPLNTKQTK